MLVIIIGVIVDIIDIGLDYHKLDVYLVIR